MEKKYVVGVDVGGQTSKIGLVDREGAVLRKTVIRSDTYGSDSELYLKALAEAILDCINEAGVSDEEVIGVGVGAPNANYYTGEIAYAANLAWASDGIVKFSERLSSLLGGMKVTITNDANAAALGEMTYGIAKGMKNFIMITLGTGVGSGIIIDGKLLYGSDGYAGELGHTTIIREGGRPCGCGRTGCMEAYVSATGVARTAKEWLEKYDEPSLLRDATEISSKTVFEAAEKGDKLSIRLYEHTGELLGRSFANFVAFSSPEAIILFGGLTKAQKFFLPALEKSFNNNLLRVWKGKVKILISSLPESDAAILGASSLAW